MNKTNSNPTYAHRSSLQRRFTFVIQSARNTTRTGLFAAATVAILAGPVSVTTVHADDTEVFFGRADVEQQIKPNVLFALDTSGSMTERDGGTESRITRMKRALTGIIEGATNLNIGLMRFNGTEGGGPILYPVTDIDTELCNGNNCDEIVELNRVSEVNNDAEQRLNDGVVDLDGTILSMGTDFNGTPKQRVGIRFPGLNIPSGATITSARLEFTAKRSDSADATLTIAAEQVDNSLAFTGDNNNLSGRATGTAQAWSPEPWEQAKEYQTPDITPVIQEIISRPGWCAGNALSILVDGDGTRSAMTADEDPNLAPALRLTFDVSSIPAGAGCAAQTVISTIKERSDDAEENYWNGNMDLTSTDLEINYVGRTPQILGMRFQSIEIPRGATIQSASIEFEIDENQSGNMTTIIAGEATDNPGTFTTQRRNVTNRPITTARVNWVNPPAPTVNSKLTTPDLTNIVQELVNRGGWNPGNAMAFVIYPTGTAVRRVVETIEGEPSNAPRLTIKYQAQGFNRLTVRDVLIEEIDNLQTRGGTPILDVLYEAGNYMRGQPVEFGRGRGRYNIRHWRHRVSHEASYTGGTVSRPSTCTPGNYEHTDCRNELILGDPVYKSPMTSSCQSNHIVLLSDGEPTSQASGDRVRTLINKNNCQASGSAACISELAEWMATRDNAPHIPEDQEITTYTIGFGEADGLDFLETISNAGLGRHFTAVSSEELQTAFERILSDVLDVNTTFVAPGATVNQFNRLTHRNDIYFSLFRPRDQPRWEGNLKKYRLFTRPDNTVDIVDANGDSAVDDSTGFFASGSRSLWSDRVDGNSVGEGGAASQINLDHYITGPRRVYTYAGNGDPVNVELTAAANQLHENNTAITHNLLGIDGQTLAQREHLLRWARGIDVDDENNDNSTTDVRLHMGDPMHSRPLIVNYNNGLNTIDSTIFSATNEGFIHAVDHQDGDEHFAFIPKELLANLDAFYQNDPTTPHPYGLDGHISFWMDDKNNNTLVDDDERAYLFAGMRRGGNSYYALDVTNRDKPVLKWAIHGGPGGTPGFENLGQTWSVAGVHGIQYGGVDGHPVLIFAGGYDTNQDDDPAIATRPRREDDRGSSIFVVDVETGELIASLSKENSGPKNIRMPGMDYSIPSDIRVIDMDLDGNADQMYVGDMGGQIWRFDFDYQRASGALIDGGVIADFGDVGDNSPEDNRRFYYQPDTAVISHQGQRFLSLAIGSGWRAHPLDEVVEDRFYAMRLPLEFGRPENGNYGKPVTNGSVTTYRPYTEDDLLDVTNEAQPSSADIFAHDGWFIRLPQTGEKVLGGAITINNQIVFTTYVPDENVVHCEPAIGSGLLYAVSALDGSPTTDFGGNNDGNRQNLGVEDRTKILAHSGIPPEPSALITEENVPVLAAGQELIGEIEFGSLTNRTWWQEASTD